MGPYQEAQLIWCCGRLNNVAFLFPYNLGGCVYGAGIATETSSE